MKVRLAQIKDFDRIAELEKSRIDNSIAYDKKTLLDYYNHNNNMFYVVVDDMDIVEGFALISPIKESAANKFELGIAIDLADIDIDEILTKEEYNLNSSNNQRMFHYLGDIVGDPKHQSTAILTLIKKILIDNVDDISTIYATPVSKEGKRTIELLGFTKVNSNNTDLYSNYKMNIFKLTNEIIEGKEIERSMVGNYLKRKLGRWFKNEYWINT